MLLHIFSYWLIIKPIKPITSSFIVVSDDESGSDKEDDESGSEDSDSASFRELSDYEDEISNTGEEEEEVVDEDEIYGDDENYENYDDYDDGYD